MDMVNNNNNMQYNSDIAEPERKTVLGIRSDALIEIIGAMIIFWLLDTIVFDGSRFYNYDLPVNPFLVLILFFTMQYGSITGLIAAFVSVLIFFIGNTALGISDLARTEIAMIPVFWIALAGFLGLVRDSHIRERKRFHSKLNDALAREKVTAEAYQEVRSRKQRLEERVASEMRSALTVYQSAKSLENMAPNHLMRSLENMLRDLLGAETFSLFMMEHNALDAAITSNWHGSYTSLPRRYTSSSQLYQHVVGNREVLTAANTEHEQILAGEGLLAAPVVTPTGEVLGMIKVESLPFARFGIQTVETLRLVAEWAAAALNNARHYESALSLAVEDPRKQLLTANYFERFTSYITSLGKRAGFPVTMVGVGLSLPENISSSDEVKIGRIISESVKSSLRNVDLAFDYEQGSSQYAILLPNTPRAGAEIVRERIESAIESKLRDQGLRHPFATTVQELAA